MSSPERARDRRLLIELSRINNDYGILQREALQDLARSRQDLAEAHGILGVVAHDLRTPLQAVIGFAEFLLDEDLDPDQRDLAERIAHSGRVMSELTDELLETVAGRNTPPAAEPVDVAKLVGELASRYNLLAESSGTRVVTDVAVPRDLRIEGDTTKLRRAFENLITNAIKFSPVGGAVRVALVLRDSAVEFTVSDDGPGIDPSQQEAVFTAFHRAPGSTGVQGIGLGLGIVREIVESHGGTVSVTSQPGAGATFAVRLPLTAPR